MTKIAPPVSGSEFAEGKKSARRWMPIDHDLGDRRLSDEDNHDLADKDHFRQLKQFRRTDDMSAEPSRDKGCEPGHDAAKSKSKEK